MTGYRKTFTAALALGIAACAPAYGDTKPAVSASSFATAVAAADRPEEARKLDENRKPAEVLAFLGLEPGMTAADLLTGEGYWAEIMGHAVGTQGKVIAYQPAQFYTDDGAKTAWAALEARSPQVSESRYPFDVFAPAANSLDFAIISLSYHDIYWESERYKIPMTDPDAYLRGLYAGMKPGGIIGVIDHVGEGTDTRMIVDKYHRIDPAVVRADFERAGFRLVAESDMLANPTDNHEISVFDPSIRGKTDRFLMKFVKPR